MLVCGVLLMAALLLLTRKGGRSDPCHSDETPILIVTINTGNDTDDYLESLRNHESYASSQPGYDFLNAASLTTKDAGEESVHPYMEKAYALRSILNSPSYRNYKYILWIDRDAIFMDHTISIRQRLAEISAASRNEFEFDLYVAVERWAWLNSGVLLFRNTDFSRKLVDEWIKTYSQREKNWKSQETIHIGGIAKRFSDLFQRRWSCEDQGALIALLAGYDGEQKWETDRFDGLTVPHVLHTPDEEWTRLSTELILASRYQSNVKVVPQEWLNSNPRDHSKSAGNTHTFKPIIYHFNGQNNKKELIAQFNKEVKKCT